jgi:uncharacterized protein YyaL (SSP411 family)
MKKLLIPLFVIFYISTSHPQELTFYQKATSTLEAIYTHYGVEGTTLLRENSPHNNHHNVTYLNQGNQGNPFAYLWPFSGTISAVTTLLEMEKNPKYVEIMNNRVLPALAEYWDTRYPSAYASYIRTAPQSDRFYDDNVWIGLDFVDLYSITGDRAFLEKSETVWKFVLSGKDDKLGGGIYWVEQNRNSKNTCSNAPGAVYALKLFEVTGDSAHFHTGVELYEWTKEHLQDDDFLYLDAIRLDGSIDRRKFTYNSGQMMQAAALLYKLTENVAYLIDAQNIAKACYDYFFSDFVGKDGEEFRLLGRGNTWFAAIMLRGFIELYHLDGNKTYIDTFKQNLTYAWAHARNEYGLFTQDFSGERIDERKWLLAQAAMVEMYARLTAL